MFLKKSKILVIFGIQISAAQFTYFSFKCEHAPGCALTCSHSPGVGGCAAALLCPGSPGGPAGGRGGSPARGRGWSDVGGTDLHP